MSNTEQPDHGELFSAIVRDMGLTIHGAKRLGKWLHVDTNKSDEPAIRSILASMGAESIRTLPAGADGKHMDGSRHQRIVAEF